MARVYVSSTFKDLKDCREQVRLTLQRTEHEAIAMETYTAQDIRPVDKCLRDVESCDLYICIVAWRYGYIPPDHEHSVTELEYRRAVEAGKTCLAFVLAEDASWPGDRYEFPMIGKVQAFRQKLQEDHLTAFFTSDADIGARVAEAVYSWAIEQGTVPRGGRTNWEAYRAAVFDKHRGVRLEAIAGPEYDQVSYVPLTEVFVAQQTTTGRPTFDIPEDPAAAEGRGGAGTPSTEDAEAEALLQEDSLQIIGREPRQVILGGPGSGKSTLLLYAMLTLCAPAPSEDEIPPGLQIGTLPFLIELRQYALRKASGEVKGFVDYLVTRASDFYGPDVAAGDLRALLDQEGRTLILFDGLDEILKEDARAGIADQIDAFARRYPAARIVASSRIVGYNDRLQSYGFTHYTLQDFGLAEIREFLPRWYRHYTWRGDERDVTGLLDQITGNPRRRELAGNPLLLTMMATLSKHQELPEERWRLYQRCTEVLLEHWDVKRKNIEQDQVFPLGFRMTGKQKAEILQHVSMHMLRQHREGAELNAIRREPLIRVLATYIRKEFEKTPGDAQVIATEVLDHLRERTYILAEVGEDVFGFVHRTFMEYFAACHALAEFNRREADYDWLTQEFFDTCWRREEWQEVLLLLVAMLVGQDSPIRKIVDHLRGLEVDEPPWNIVFAAHCLAEAGTSDISWARALLDRLGQETLGRAGQARGPGGDEFVGFVNQALSAFSMLVPAVRPSEQLAAKIEASERGLRRHRMVAWQMKLALRSREERLPFALRALTDRVETVRVSAVIALEREWPGREEIGPYLISVLRTDRAARVRQAAVQALRRSWPDQPGILEAIAARAGDETASTYVEWLIRYISSEWRHDLAALEVVLRLAATKPRQPAGYDHDIVEAAAEGIHAGWGDRYGVGAWLRNRFAAVRDQRVRDAILIAFTHHAFNEAGLLGWLQEQVDRVPASGIWTARSFIIGGIASSWAGQPELLPWLQRHATDDDPETRRAALAGIAAGWGEDAQVRAWLGQRATEDPDVEIRLRGLALAGGLHLFRRLLVRLVNPRRTQPDASWWPWEAATDWRGHPESIPLLEAQAVNDPAPAIRRAALGGVYAYHRAGAAAGLDLLYARLTQEPDRDTRAMILLMLTEGASGGTALPRGLAVTLGFIDQGSHPADRPFSGFARPRSSADGQLRATLTSVAEHDGDGGIRAAAGQALSALWPDSAAVSEFLAARSENDPDQGARILLRSFRTGRQAPRAP